MKLSTHKGFAFIIYSKEGFKNFCRTEEKSKESKGEENLFPKEMKIAN